MQTFNGLSSAVPRVQKLNKYLSYKYIGALAVLSSFSLSNLLIFSSLFVSFPSPRRSCGLGFQRILLHLWSIVLYLGRLTVQALIEQRRCNFPALLIPTAPGFLTCNVIFMRTGAKYYCFIEN